MGSYPAWVGGRDPWLNGGCKMFVAERGYRGETRKETHCHLVPTMLIVALQAARGLGLRSVSLQTLGYGSRGDAARAHRAVAQDVSA